jgi:MbtH protein
MAEMEPEELYIVVMNHQGQYSIWPKDRALPAGWKEGGKSGSKDECLGYIQDVWIDMRPLRLIQKMEADKGSSGGDGN